MKQIVFSRRSPARLADVPVPALKRGFILVRTHFSAVSIGTERAAGVGGTNLLRKVLEKPGQIKQVLDMAMSQGIASAAQRVTAALDAWMPSGYSNAGVVVAVADDVNEFKVGDRVACSGGGYAVHAEFCVVPRRLAARIPDGVATDAAAFATIGAVAMHGFRVGEVGLGETVAVIGLGIVGQLLCQIAAAAGARVIALDLDSQRTGLAASLSGGTQVDISSGSEVATTYALTGERGVDVVFLCAATSSDEPARLGMSIARDRGRVVVVGDVGLDIDRQLMYEKELDLRISRSYGPGRYDRDYEERGHDYPFGYVRWTQQRNVEAFLELLERGALKIAPLITHRATLENAEQTLALLSSGEEKPLGVLLGYDIENTPVLERSVRPEVANSRRNRGLSEPRIALIGPGAFASSVLLPALARNGVRPVVIAGNGGLAAADVARRIGATQATTDVDAVFSDPGVDAVMISSRHDSHAGLVIRALEAGKHVYVEKPLGTTYEQLEAITTAYNRSDCEVMVGFNRRFAPFAVRAREWLPAEIAPMILYRVNAGVIDSKHWTRAGDDGGGRIIGEACHFIDLMQFFARSPIKSVHAQAMRGGIGLEQDACITVSFQNGAIGTLLYTAQGSANYRKEYIELFAGGRVACIDDFSALTVAGSERNVRSGARQDKGFTAEMAAWLAHLRGGGPCPIPFAESLSSSIATIAAIESARGATTVEVPTVQ
jgi:predicted dehydrogenase